MVILVAGAGGVFGKILVASGIGNAIADVLETTGLPALLLAFCRRAREGEGLWAEPVASRRQQRSRGSWR